MCGKFVFLFSVLCAFSTVVDSKTERVICYYGSWANYRNGNGKYTAEDIDATLCTNIIYTFLGIQNDGNLKILDSWLELDLKNLARFNALKRKNPNLKTSVAVGGWNEGSVKYSAVAADPTKRATLIKSAVNFLETYGFDGFDLDWEYPGQRGGSAADKKNFAILLKEFREVFDKKGFILTAAVAAASFSVDLSYDVPALSRYLDSINVMAYDLHGAYDGATGANAPLYPSSVDSTPSAKALTVDASIRGWLARGADPQKISLGLPMYGRSFTLSNSNARSFGAPASNGGVPGPYTQETGMLGYLEICELQKQGGWTVAWDNNTKTPYAHKGNQWVSYDNEESIKIKVEYAKSLNLGGVMLWSLETADFRGVCGNKYPILTSIKRILENSNPTPLPQPDDGPGKESEESESQQEESKESSSSEEDQKSSSSKEDQKSSSSEEDQKSSSSEEDQKKSKESSSSEEKDSGTSSSEDDQKTTDNLCKEVGLVRDPKSCSSFYYCVPNGNGFETIRFSCALGLVFDSKSSTCNYKHLVDCKA